MIKEIIIDGVRDINSVFKLTKLNVLKGENGTGKSTIIELIRDIYKGKTKIKKGAVTIIDENLTLSLINGNLSTGGLALGDKMDLMTPGFFLNGTKIKGVNASKEDQRKTMSEILGIDREGFFKSKSINYEIKGLMGEIRDLKVKEDTYTKQIIDLENKLSELKEIKKPKEIKLIQTTEDKIEKGNKDLLEQLKKDLEYNKSRLQKDLSEPKEIKLIQGNENELRKLKTELESIKQQGLKLVEVCPYCNQQIKNIEEFKEILRQQYIDKQKEIKEFKLIKSNLEEYNKYLKELEEVRLHNQRNEMIKNDISNIENKINNFKLVEDKIIKGVKGNEIEYKKYQEDLLVYNNYKKEKEMIENSIKELEQSLRDCNTKELQSKIDLYRQTEKEFIEMIGDKLVLGDLEFVFYKQRSKPDMDGNMYKSDFDIKYKGKLYTECSGGERGIIDILIAMLFIKKYDIIDFILIDNAEISNNNLKQIIKDYLSNLQVIVTRIDTGKLKLVKTL